MKDFFFWASIAFAASSAALGIYSALIIEVRNNQDVFIGDLARQSNYTAFAAACAGVSVLFQALDRWLG